MVVALGCGGDGVPSNADLCDHIQNECTQDQQCLSDAQWQALEHAVGEKRFEHYRHCLAHSHNCADIGDCDAEVKRALPLKQ